MLNVDESFSELLAIRDINNTVCYCNAKAWRNFVVVYLFVDNYFM